MGRKIVIVGGGAAGSTAAQFARKTDRKADITIFEAGAYPQYSKCALPYFISKSVRDVIEFDKEWFERANIKLFLKSIVRDADIEEKKVLVEQGRKKIEEKFDSLIIATGAEPFSPPITGIDAKGIFSLRTLDDAKSISSLLSRVKHAVIIGAGAIGLEMAEALYKMGIKITIVEMLPSILPGMLDKDMANILQKYIPQDITIFTSHKVIEIKKKGDWVNSVIVEDARGKQAAIDADIVLVATGIRANTKLAKKIGCKIGENNGIIINERCQTTIEDVYAVGDCTEYIDFVTGKPFLVGLGSIAVRQGIVAGINAAGGDSILPEGFLQTRTTKLFGIEVAATGATTNQLHGKEPIAGRFTGNSLPEYFPGGKEITVKVIADPSYGTIIGAQSIGANASQRINTLACAIMNKMSLKDFIQMETAYAPPIAPTLDPMTIACDIARMRYEKMRMRYERK